ncbi:class I SAM-dependent DNA methyltransferase [Candidatus Uhrbacteria bacterium]|nr:class I SAM-dependent DNA methyltransferase [Candidatus Uhrbacteria bacterium]
MPLSWNEVRARATNFSKEWVDAQKEASEKQTFWNEFFEIFGISRRKVATFEEGVRKYEGEHGSIDLLYPGKLIVEHKSAGKNLDDAYQQAIEYASGLPEKVAPTHIVVSDFAHFRVYDLEQPLEKRMIEFPLRDLSKNVRHFGFLLGYQTVEVKAEDPVNRKAVKAIAKLHDSLKQSGYVGHQLEILLVRLVYCFFADDTGIFDDLDSFQSYMEKRTNVDGSDTGPILAQIFQVLNQSVEKRQNNLDEDLAKLPYIDGPLFSERLDLPSFDADMRQTLLECSAFDWGKVSPVIFGSMFQSVMNEKERHDLGAHYTSETNIFKVINSLFLDELKAELEAAGKSKQKLTIFLDKLRSLRFLDPACGCGNFLVVTYRELRRLELEALKRLNIKIESGARQLSALQFGALSQVNVDQMYGIEIEEFPARVAELALWLTDHQMNMELSAEFGERFVRLPLKAHPNIHIKNALRIDWEDVLPKSRTSYVLGNPPFLGKKEQSKEQKEDMELVWGDAKGAGVLDYVSCWYKKATDFIQGTRIVVAFVSTNSITQGEQAGVLWPKLLEYGIKIHFAHRTFKWSNEASGKSAVHCVIVGLGHFDVLHKELFDYPDINSEAHRIIVSNINPYLVDAPDVVVTHRTQPFAGVPPMNYGSMAIDKGFLILSPEEAKKISDECPKIISNIRPFVGGEEFINGNKRYCLWLIDTDPAVIRGCASVTERLDAVRSFRASSGREATKRLADTPSQFGEVRQPRGDYLLIPKVSSENRRYIPIGIMPSEVIANGSALVISQPSLFLLGVLSSTMHMAWMRAVCGRLESRYQYSAQIVYNNFPWPREPSETQIKAVEAAAQGVLDARAAFPNSTLADLYDPDTTPPKLVKAHHDLDKAVDKCYGKKSFANETERLEFLFGLYGEYLKEAEGREKGKKKAKTVE